MPSWSVAPSSMSVATLRAMAAWRGWISRAGSSRRGRSVSTIRWIRRTWMKESPSVRGIPGFTSAMTSRAHSAAAFVQSTPTPNEQ